MMADAASLPSSTVEPSGATSMPGHSGRQLASDELEKLEKDTKVLSDFKQRKLENEAKKNWDLFYKRNTTKFFKDRHWTTREFSELCGSQVDGSGRQTILEVGCGVGNFIFPLIKEIPNTFFFACDFSPRAVQFVKDNALYSADRCHAFQCDLTCDSLTTNVPPGSVDIVTMIFVLSAIHPDKMQHALRNIRSVLKPGGCVLIRDYGLYDHAMLRFAPGHKLSDHFYVRQDGTRAFFFSKESLATIFEESGFEQVSNDYIIRETVNRKEGLCVPRVFVQGKFTKICDTETPERRSECEHLVAEQLDLKPSSVETVCEGQIANDFDSLTLSDNVDTHDTCNSKVSHEHS